MEFLKHVGYTPPAPPPPEDLNLEPVAPEPAAPPAAPEQPAQSADDLFGSLAAAAAEEPAQVITLPRQLSASTLVACDSSGGC